MDTRIFPGRDGGGGGGGGGGAGEYPLHPQQALDVQRIACNPEAKRKQKKSLVSRRKDTTHTERPERKSS